MSLFVTPAYLIPVISMLKVLFIVFHGFVNQNMIIICQTRAPATWQQWANKAVILYWDMGKYWPVWVIGLSASMNVIHIEMKEKTGDSKDINPKQIDRVQISRNHVFLMHYPYFRNKIIWGFNSPLEKEHDLVILEISLATTMYALKLAKSICFPREKLYAWRITLLFQYFDVIQIRLIRNNQY